MNKNVWVSGPAATGMSTTGSPYVQRNFRVEVPVYGSSEDIVFSDKTQALAEAKKWAVEDKILVLVWDFLASMYIARFDGRGDAGICDQCEELSHTLKTVDGDNPDRVRDLCIVCRCGDPGY